MNVSDIQLYLDRAHQALEASISNLQRKHSGVISAFGQYFVNTGLIEVEYAKMFGQAFTSRLDSDYDIAFLLDDLLAETMAEDAQKFIDRIEKYLQVVDIL